MAKLTDAHKEQIKSMREEGKTYDEIRDFYKEKYNIKLFDCDIARAVKGTSFKKESRVIAIRVKRGRCNKELPPGRIEPIAETEQDNLQFVTHIRAAFDIYKRGFLKQVESTITAECAK